VFVTRDGLGTRHRTYASGVLETCAPIGSRFVERPARKRLVEPLGVRPAPDPY